MEFRIPSLCLAAAVLAVFAVVPATASGPQGESRLGRSLRISAERDSARRMDNLYLGVGTSLALFTSDPGADTGYMDLDICFDLLFGYRRHFTPQLGLRLGTLLRIGPQPDRIITPPSHLDSLGRPDTDEGQAEGGIFLGVQARAQAILGPFGRFTLEPGLAVGYDRISARTIKWFDQASAQLPTQQFATVAAVLGASMFLGPSDQINPTAFISVGRRSGSAFGTNVEGGVGIALAFREE